MPYLVWPAAEQAVQLLHPYRHEPAVGPLAHVDLGLEEDTVGPVLDGGASAARREAHVPEADTAELGT